MESIWIPLFGPGLCVMLVDPRRIKNVPGRKTDVLRHPVAQQLHTYGLLSGAFPSRRGDGLRSCASEPDLVEPSGNYPQKA